MEADPGSKPLRPILNNRRWKMIKKQIKVRIMILWNTTWVSFRNLTTMNTTLVVIRAIQLDVVHCPIKTHSL
jgi:hypothetical protein